MLVIYTKIHIGERTASSTNGTGKTDNCIEENETKSSIPHHAQKPTPNGSKTLTQT